jgi:F-type H+-transporting ATPase subunit b
MLQTISVFGETSSSGLGALGISGQALLIQLVTFGLAYLVLRRYAFKPILKVLDERRQTIESGVSLGEAMQKEQADLDKKVAAALHIARQSADVIIADAQDAARAKIRQAEDRARQKADDILADAHTQAEQNIQRMRKQLEGELVGLISDATEMIIDEKVDATKDAALIDKALKGRKTA